MDKIVDFISDLMAKTAWTMEKPAAYGPFHLTFAIVGILICIAFSYLLRNLGDKGNRRLLQGVAVFLILTEIYKQCFYTFYIGGGTYQWWIFPFQMCSIPMYFGLLAPVFKKGGRVQRSMYSFLAFFNFLGGISAFIEPSGIVYEYWTLTLHAFIWHMTVNFISLYLIISKRVGTKWSDYFLGVFSFLLLCIIAFGLNLLFWDVSGGDINMFYVGPRNSPLVICKDIAKKYGWYVSTAVYVPAVCLGGMVVFLVVKFFTKLASKKITEAEL